MEGFEVTIIGAGVVGLAIAARLSEEIPSVLVIERNTSFGMETSSRNSEVIHAGIYYPQGSLKAKTCIEGNRHLYEICLKNNIAHKKTGKLIVALDKNEVSELEKLFDNARRNGVNEIELISKKKVADLEPNIKAEAAIFSRSTGIIDSHRLMEFFMHKALEQKALIAFKTKLVKITRQSQAYQLTVSDSEDQPMDFVSQIVINCAGLESDSVAASAGIDVEKQGYRLSYCKGQYYKVSERKSRLISRLVYPLPHSSLVGLGIHATLNLAGCVRLGPDHRYIKRDDADYDVEASAHDHFFNSARTYLPFLEPEDLSPDTAGIRPKLQTENGPFRDFVIQDESAVGLPGLIDLIGIESPGLTASPAIAEYVSRLVRGRVSSKVKLS